MYVYLLAALSACVGLTISNFALESLTDRDWNEAGRRIFSQSIGVATLLGILIINGLAG